MLNGSFDIEAERLVLSLVIDIAIFVISRVKVELLNISMRHAAERGTDKIRGWLEIERNIEPIMLMVSGEILLEPAHDVCLLRLGELGPAIVNGDRYNFALFKEEEFDDQVVP